MTTFIHLNSDGLGFWCGNSYHNGLTRTCTLLVALIYNVLLLGFCQLCFKLQNGEKKKKVFSHDTFTR